MVNSTFMIAPFTRVTSIVAVLLIGLLTPEPGWAESPDRPQAKALIYSQAWDNDQAPQAFAKFRAWVQRHAANPAGTNTVTPQQISQGVELAKKRKEAL